MESKCDKNTLFLDDRLGMEHNYTQTKCKSLFIWSGKVKYELRVQIYVLQVQIHGLRVQIYELRVSIYKLRVQIHELGVQIRELGD